MRHYLIPWHTFLKLQCWMQQNSRLCWNTGTYLLKLSTGVGVGKTMMAGSVLEGLPPSYSSMNINFSAQTSSNSLQDTIEGKLEKRTKVS